MVKATLAAVLLMALGGPASAESGHRGPVVGTALLGGPNTGGAELFLGWAHRMGALALWARIQVEGQDLDAHGMLGAAVRWWPSVRLERLYLEGRLGYDHMDHGMWEEDFRGPSYREGLVLGGSLCFEVVRHAVVAPLDVRIGYDRVELLGADNREYLWLGLGLTFY